MNEQNRELGDENLLTRLLQASGRGPSAAPEAKARIYDELHEHWRASLPRSAEVARKAVPRAGRSTLTRRLALAATLAAVAIVAYRVQAPRDVPALPFASVVKSEGNIEIRRGNDVRRLRPGVPTSVSIGDTLTTDSGAKVALLLGNGYVLRVNAGSELAIAASNNVALHSGAVYFDSNNLSHDDPLTIETALGSVRHSGTQFEASLVDFGLRLRVREGAAVFSDGSRELIARAGEQMHVGSSGTPRQSSIAADDPAWQWVEDLATLQPADEYPLPKVLAWISRETGRGVRFDDVTTETRAQTVVLYDLDGLTPRQTVEALRSTTAFEFRDVDGVLLVADGTP